MKSLYVTAASVVLLIAHVAAAQIQVRHEPGGQAFELASAAQVAAVMVDPAETAVVRNAARLLADDVERVTMRPAAPTPAGAAIPNAVIAGTLGQSATIDRLVSEG